MYEEIKTIVTKTLEEIQQYGGGSSQKVTGTTCPLRDLPGFDSLNAAEAMVMISGRIGCNVKSEIMLQTHMGKPLDVDEISRRITTYVETRGGIHHARHRKQEGSNS